MKGKSKLWASKQRASANMNHLNTRPLMNIILDRYVAKRPLPFSINVNLNLTPGEVYEALRIQW